MGSSVLTTLGNLGVSAQGFLLTLADVACFAGDVKDRGSRLRTAQQHSRRARVVGRSVWFRHFCQSTAQGAGKCCCDGAVVPFQGMWMFLGSWRRCLLGLLRYSAFPF